MVSMADRSPGQDLAEESKNDASQVSTGRLQINMYLLCFGTRETLSDVLVISQT